MLRKYVYFAKTSVGTFWIRPEKDRSWSLCIEAQDDAEIIGYYDHPDGAAHDVYLHEAGLLDWDRLQESGPDSLLQWDKRVLR